jgi:hypothetical protein
MSSLHTTEGDYEYRMNDAAYAVGLIAPAKLQRWSIMLLLGTLTLTLTGSFYPRYILTLNPRTNRPWVRYLDLPDIMK